MTPHKNKIIRIVSFMAQSYLGFELLKMLLRFGDADAWIKRCDQYEIVELDLCDVICYHPEPL